MLYFSSPSNHLESGVLRIHLLYHDFIIIFLRYIHAVSAGFGWSLSDVTLLAQFANKIHHALKEENGSSSEYQQATTTFLSLQSTLEEIRHGLRSADPSFRNAIQGQLDGPTSSISDFNANLRKKYGDKLNTTATAGGHHSTWQKVKWALSAADDLKEFWISLSRQLEIVKLLMISETKGDTAAIGSKVMAIQISSTTIEKELSLLLSNVANVDSKVVATQQPLRDIEQQLSLVLPVIHQSRTPYEVPPNDTRDRCQTNHFHLQDLRRDYKGIAKGPKVRYRALEDQKYKTTDVLTDLIGEVSSLSLQVGDASSAILDRQKTEAAKIDAALALLRELHALRSDLKNHDMSLQKISHHARIQDHFNNVQKTVEGFITVPAEVYQSLHCRLLKSLNGMTSALIGLLDTGVLEAESRFEWSCQFCKMATLFYQFGTISPNFTRIS